MTGALHRSKTAMPFAGVRWSAVFLIVPATIWLRLELS
jgi:hypothetical protein